MKYRTKGLTLVEIIVAAAILILLCSLIINSLLTGMGIYNTSVVSTNLDTSSEYYVNICKGELYTAGKWILNTSIPRIQFQVPTDLDGDGDTVIQGNYGENIIEWGYNGQANLWAVYEFVSSKILDEITDNFNYNGDADTLDRFVSGAVYKRVYIGDPGTGSLTPPPVLSYLVADSVIFKVDSANQIIYYADINEDGLADPPFQFIGKDASGNDIDVTLTNPASAYLVKINIWMMKKYPYRQDVILKNYSQKIEFRNIAQE